MTFVTFLEDRPKIATENGEIGPFKEGETVELPDKTAEILLNDDSVVRWAWQCQRCGEIHKTEKKPPICQNPNCSKKGPFKSIHPTEHYQIGNTLMKNYVFRTMRESEQIYMHDGEGIFENVGTEAKIKEKTKEILPDCKSHLQEEVVKHIMTSTGRSKEEFGLPKERIVVENGILDLNERELKEENLKEEIPLSKLPVKYNPDADCPKIKDFLYDIFRDEDIPVIQEFIGYCLWKSYDYAKVLVLLGDGENGKSTFLNLLTKFLAQENVSSTSLYGLLTNIKRRVNLYGKLANLAAETPDAIKNTDAFKKMTGKDLIEARKLYKQPFKFYNYAKLIFAANELPELDEHTHAMFRRMILIDCPYKFTTNPNDNHKDADTDILEKITSDEEMSGFLNWALDGLERLLKNDKFSETKTQQEIQERWVRETDPERAFINKFIETDYEYSVVRADIHKAYSDYCKKHELKACDQGPLTKAVNRIVPGAKKWKPKVGEKQKKSFRNIRLKEPYTDYNNRITDSTGTAQNSIILGGVNDKNNLQNTHKYKKLSSNHDNRDISQEELFNTIFETLEIGDFTKDELVNFLVENNDFDRGRVAEAVRKLIKERGDLIELSGGDLEDARQ